MKKLLLLLFALAPSLATAQNAPSVTPPVLAAGAYNSAPPTCTTNNGCYLQTDSHGNLNVNIAGGGGSGGTSQTDQAAFTYGTTAYTPMGGVYNSAITNLTSGQGGAVALTAARSMHVLEDNSASILSAVQSPIPAGSSIIGKVGIDQTTPGTTNAVQAIPGTSGGLSWYFVQPAASDNHANIKNGAGQVYNIHVTNNSATINYLRLYDAGTGFNGCNSATNLKGQWGIPASTSLAGIALNIPDGISFSTGISICVTSGYATTDTTNATASAMSVNVGYK